MNSIENSKKSIIYKGGCLGILDKSDRHQSNFVIHVKEYDELEKLLSLDDNEELEIQCNPKSVKYVYKTFKDEILLKVEEFHIGNAVIVNQSRYFDLD